MRVLSAFVAIILLSATPSLAQTGSVFECPSLELSEEVPTSVHRLRPSDIKVIGAMGNSLTAGFCTLFNVPFDYRGQSWSGGGDGDLSSVTTLPNILRQYSPDLYGYAVGFTPPVNFSDLPNVRFNVAVSGARAEHMLEQAESLVAKMSASDMVDFEEDWKVVTMYIGSNDLCQLPCRNDPLGDPDVWIGNITTALDYLQENLPRAFINLVQLPDYADLLDQVLTNTEFAPTCQVSLGDFICPCSPIGSLSMGDQFSNFLQDYQENLRSLVDSGRYEASDDFTVVLQLFASQVVLDKVDGEADLSPFVSDCAHLSPVGNRALAIGLWNNMFERVGQKATVTRISGIDISCPTDEEPYIFTSQNSGSVSLQAVSLYPVTVAVSILYLVLVKN